MGVSASREVISSSRWAILDEISRSIWLKRQIYVDLWSFLVVSGALIYGPCLGPLFGRPDVVWSGLPRVSRSTVGIYFIHIDCKFHWDIFVTTSNLVSYIQNSLRYICNSIICVRCHLVHGTRHIELKGKWSRVPFHSLQWKSATNCLP